MAQNTGVKQFHQFQNKLLKGDLLFHPYGPADMGIMEHLPGSTRLQLCPGQR